MHYLALQRTSGGNNNANLISWLYLDFPLNHFDTQAKMPMLRYLFGRCVADKPQYLCEDYIYYTKLYLQIQLNNLTESYQLLIMQYLL